jgi:predicted Zn-dependent peptidase
MVRTSSQPVRKRVFENGVTLLHQPNLRSRTFCVGLWIKSGSREERPGEEGLCHFLEHMLFKGTERRRAVDISREVERVGGSIDAFTTKEQVCLYVQLLEDRAELAFDILGDMVLHSTFPPQEIRRERQVVLEEIRDVLDSPDDLIGDVFAAMLFPGHPLGHPILGSRSTVSRFSRPQLVRFARRVLRGPNIVVSVCGNVDLRTLSRWVERAFPFPDGSVRPRTPPIPRRWERKRHLHRPLHQQHLCVGSRGVSYHDEDRFAFMVLASLLGGGMASRLFRRIREELGLAYTVYTYTEYGRDAGLIGTYLATRPDQAALALEAVLEEFEAVRSGKVTDREIEETKEHLEGRILLGLETASAKMMRMARNEIYYGRQVGEVELVRQIRRIGRDDLVRVAHRVLSPEALSLATIGPSRAGLKRFSGDGSGEPQRLRGAAAKG